MSYILLLNDKYHGQYHKVQWLGIRLWARKLGVIVLSNSLDIIVRQYMDLGFKLVGGALALAKEAPAYHPQVDGVWAAYQGVYRTVWWEAHIMILGGRLVFFKVEAEDPLKNSMILDPTDKAHIFRMIQTDGIFGGLLEFQLDASGEVTGLRFPGEELIRVQGR